MLKIHASLFFLFFPSVIPSFSYLCIRYRFVIMTDLEIIIEPIQAPLARFEAMFAQSVRSDSVPMQEIMSYLVDTRGKRFRPILVFLTASLFGEITEQTYRVATFVEMLHTATLLHDDVVDRADTRRGIPSVNARWDNTSAVLAGDYLLAKALLLFSNPQDAPILNEMLQTTLAMSESELNNNLYCSNSINSDFRPPTSVSPPHSYLSLIEKKTALLIRSCCVAAAMSVCAPLSAIPLLADFGLNLGLVFQMRDDLLDADNPAATAWAGQLLPEYTSKALSSLEALSSIIGSSDNSHPSCPSHSTVLTSLRHLTNFCATRTL